MHKIIYFWVLILSFSSVCAVPKLIDIQGNINPTLKELSIILGLESKKSPVEYNELFQKNFLRKPGSERWEMSNTFEDKRDQVLPILEKLGVLSEVRPKRAKYDTALILGATVHGMRARFAHLIELWHNGTRYDEITFLVGERELDPIREDEKELLSPDNPPVPIRLNWEIPKTLPQTETDAAKMIVDQCQLPLAMREIPIHFISTPTIKNPVTGKTRRPTTAHTVLTWLNTNPKVKTILAISSNPYVGYQDATLRGLLTLYSYIDKIDELDTVGEKAAENLSIAIHLDNIARWLYTELSFQN